VCARPNSPEHSRQAGRRLPRGFQEFRGKRGGLTGSTISRSRSSPKHYDPPRSNTFRTLALSARAPSAATHPADGGGSPRSQSGSSRSPNLVSCALSDRRQERRTPSTVEHVRIPQISKKVHAPGPGRLLPAGGLLELHPCPASALLMEPSASRRCDESPNFGELT
jgi:hypothetical protein